MIKIIVSKFTESQHQNGSTPGSRIFPMVEISVKLDWRKYFLELKQLPYHFHEKLRFCKLGLGDFMVPLAGLYIIMENLPLCGQSLNAEWICLSCRSSLIFEILQDIFLNQIKNYFRMYSDSANANGTFSYLKRKCFFGNSVTRCWNEK